MTQCRVLTRGEACRAQLTEALDALGVAVGEQFMVVPCVDGRVGEDRVGPHVAGSPTSRAAAFANLPRTGTQRRILLDLLSGARDGHTRDELADLTGLLDSAVRPRVVELMRGGWVRATMRTRPSRAGEDAEIVVWTGKTP